MTPYPFRRLIAAVAALSLGLTGPLPAYAMRVSETVEGGGLEELGRTLGGSPAVATPRSSAVAHPAAGMEETIRGYVVRLLGMVPTAFIKEVEQVLAEWDVDAYVGVLRKIYGNQLSMMHARSGAEKDLGKLQRAVRMFQQAKLEVDSESVAGAKTFILMDVLLVAYWAKHSEVTRDEWRAAQTMALRQLSLPRGGRQPTGGSGQRPGSRAGAEESRARKQGDWILPQHLARMLGEMADSDEGRGATIVIAQLAGPTGTNTVRIDIPGAVRDRWPEQLADACQRIGVSGALHEHWNVHIGDRARTTTALIVPITILPKGATHIEALFDVTAAQNALSMAHYDQSPHARLVEAFRDLLSHRMTYDQAVSTILSANPEAERAAIQRTLNAGISWYLGFKHQVLDDRGRPGIQYFLNGEISTVGAMHYLDREDPVLIRAILREARSFVPTAGTMTIEAFGDIVRDVALFVRHKSALPELWGGNYRVEVTRIDDEQIRVYRPEPLSTAIAQRLADNPDGLPSRFVAQDIPSTMDALLEPAVMLVTDRGVVPQGETRTPILEVSPDTIPTLQQLYLVAMTGDTKWIAIPPERVVAFHLGDTVWVAAFV